jgi:hypothetical protein
MDNYIVLHINPEYVEEDEGATILNQIAADVAKLLKPEHFDGVFALSGEWIDFPTWARWKIPTAADPRLKP